MTSTAPAEFLTLAALLSSGQLYVPPTYSAHFLRVAEEGMFTQRETFFLMQCPVPDAVALSFERFVAWVDQICDAISALGEGGL